MSFSLRFREPVGASPEPKLRSNIACDAVRGHHQRLKVSAIGRMRRKPRARNRWLVVYYHTGAHAVQIA